MTRLSLTLILPLCLTVAVACKGDSVGPERVLTTLDVSAASAALFPEATSQLTILAWDQFGVQMHGQWAHQARYASSAPEIAEVNSGGVVRGVAPGSAVITATLTLAGVSRTGSVTATVLTPTESAVVMEKDGRWSPTTVQVKAGGTVTWIAAVGDKRTIWLNVWERNPEKLEFINGLATRTFPTPGIFYYGDGSGLMWYEGGGRIQVY